MSTVRWCRAIAAAWRHDWHRASRRARISSVALVFGGAVAGHLVPGGPAASLMLFAVLGSVAGLTAEAVYWLRYLRALGGLRTRTGQATR
ncbi:hypothetical protein [Amycolatopsis magusensis]|uniref:hypothetical protein n=1 Tax=Amycolatopsis magusensis TaxID=882444 RepID=UPI003787EAA4